MDCAWGVVWVEFENYLSLELGGRCEILKGRSVKIGGKGRGWDRTRDVRKGYGEGI